MAKHDYTPLLEKFLSGAEITAPERVVLSDWFLSNDGKREMDVVYGDRWEEAGGEIAPHTSERMWQAVRAGMRKNALHAPVPTRRQGLRRIAMRYVAAAAVLVATGTAAWKLGTYNATPQGNFTVNVDRGQKASLTLPDGTKVWLNSASQLSYDGAFGVRERRVSLAGEAYFEVEKGEKRFVVSTSEFDVAVYGTRFNVKAYRDDDRYTTTLVEGSVKVVMPSGAEEDLAPSQELTYNLRNKQYAKAEMEDVADVSLWCHDQLLFKGESLDEVAVMLSRMYNVNIVCASDKVKQIRFSGIIRNTSMLNVVEAMSLTSPVKFHINGGEIVVSEDATRRHLYSFDSEKKQESTNPKTDRHD